MAASSEPDPHPSLHIVGRGAVSCFGLGHACLLDAVFAGRSGVRPLERLAEVDCLTSVAAEAPAAVTRAAAGPLDLPRHFASLAAREALANWGTAPDADTLLVLASTKAEMTGVLCDSGTDSPTDSDTDTAGLGSAHRLATRLGRELAWPGPIAAVSSACASGLSALAYAGRAIRGGRAQHALVVGTDALTPFILRGFSALLALAPGQSRPFDANRDGLNLGEGAGAIILSRAKPSEPTCQLLGWGESNDANHITGPCKDGSGLALAVDRALRHAALPPASIDCIHLHATGTPYNDGMEAQALARAFPHPPTAAGSKAQIGHTLGAAGILESLITLAALERGTAPTNYGLETADPEFGIPIQRCPTPLPRAQHAVKLAAGFGGVNAALVFGAPA